MTQLMGTVENRSLQKLGEFRFKVNNQVTDDIVPFAVTADSPFDAEIIGDGHFYKGTIDAQTNITTRIQNTQNTSGYRLSPGEYLVSITPKYGLNAINISTSLQNQRVIEMDIDDLAFLNSPIELLLTTQQNVEGVFYPISGSLESLKEKSSIAVNNSNVTGTMKDMAKFVYPNYAQTGLSRCVPSRNISGSLEEFVENCISENYGKTIALCLNYFSGQRLVTFNGTVYEMTTVQIVLDSVGNAVLNNGLGQTAATYTKATNSWSYS